MKRLLRSKVEYCALLLFVGLFATTAHAAPPQGTNIQRLFEALDNVVRADNFCHAGQGSAAQTRLRVASYRVRIVLADIRYTPGLNKAVEALTVTNQKLNDHYLDADEKVAIALDCLAVALPVLIRADARFTGQAGAALTHIKLVRYLAAAQVFGPAKDVLQKAKRFLNTVSCPTTSSNFRKAREALNVAIAKINDHALGLDEKEFFVVDCLNVAEKAIRGY